MLTFEIGTAYFVGISEKPLYNLPYSCCFQSSDIFLGLLNHFFSENYIENEKITFEANYLSCPVTGLSNLLITILTTVHMAFSHIFCFSDYSVVLFGAHHVFA